MAPFSLFYLIMWVGTAAIQSTIFKKIGKSLRSLSGTWNRATGLQQQSPKPGSWKSQKYLVSWKVSFSNVPEDEWLWAEMYFSAKYREKQTFQCRIAGDTLYGRKAQMWWLTEVAAVFKKRYWWPAWYGYHSMGASSHGSNGGQTSRYTSRWKRGKGLWHFFPQQEELKFWSMENMKCREPVLQLISIQTLAS